MSRRKEALGVAFAGGRMAHLRPRAWLSTTAKSARVPRAIARARDATPVMDGRGEPFAALLRVNSGCREARDNVRIIPARLREERDENKFDPYKQIAMKQRTRSSLSSAKETNSGGATRPYDSAQSLADILEVATQEFADKGLSGARVDEIAALTRASKRMIYYHFGSKEALYLAVLERAFQAQANSEDELRLEDLEPEEALRTLVGFSFDYHQKNIPFVRLIMNENERQGEFFAQSDVISRLNLSEKDRLRGVYDAGVAGGVFRAGINPVDLRMSIAALCFYPVSNRHTFSLLFNYDMQSPAAVSARRESVIDMILRFVLRT
jgi:AcrR family transcriptional regulator